VLIAHPTGTAGCADRQSLMHVRVQPDFLLRSFYCPVW
jgi:hypothetical protein